jgi:hypothetical protein
MRALQRLVYFLFLWLWYSDDNKTITLVVWCFGRWIMRSVGKGVWRGGGYKPRNRTAMWTGLEPELSSASRWAECKILGKVFDGVQLAGWLYEIASLQEVLHERSEVWRMGTSVFPNPFCRRGEQGIQTFRTKALVLIKLEHPAPNNTLHLTIFYIKNTLRLTMLAKYK